jgi:hypothetical protein
MKKLTILLLVELIALLCVMSSQGQVFTSGVWITNSAQSQVENSFVIQSNYASSYLSPRTVMIQGVLTNQTFSMSYGYAIAGTTNVVTYATISTNFPAGVITNGQTVIIPIPAQAYQPAVIPWGIMSVSNGFSNQVSWQ